MDTISRRKSKASGAKSRQNDLPTRLTRSVEQTLLDELVASITVNPSMGMPISGCTVTKTVFGSIIVR